MENARRYGLTSGDIYSEKNKMADDGTLAKVLFFDAVRQFKLSAGLSSVDAANCYDSTAHAIAALTFRAFGVPREAVQVMLQTIEEMKYFLTARLKSNSKGCVKEMERPRGPGRLGGHIHSHTGGSQKKGTWCQICVPSVTGKRGIISYTLRGRHGGNSFRHGEE